MQSQHEKLYILHKKIKIKTPYRANVDLDYIIHKKQVVLRVSPTNLWNRQPIRIISNGFFDKFFCTMVNPDKASVKKNTHSKTINKTWHNYKTQLNMTCVKQAHIFFRINALRINSSIANSAWGFPTSIYILFIRIWMRIYSFMIWKKKKQNSNENIKSFWWLDIENPLFKRI